MSTIPAKKTGATEPAETIQERFQRLAAGWRAATAEDGSRAAVAGVERVESSRYVFTAVGYTVCDNDLLEPGYEKIALFALGGVPKHAARQLPTGQWTSKLGPMEDIEHALNDL